MQLIAYLFYVVCFFCAVLAIVAFFAPTSDRSAYLYVVLALIAAKAGDALMEPKQK